jgi:predicted RNase H-like HicB family nuclease
MKDPNYYDSLPWDVQIERDLRKDGSMYYIARNPEFGPLSGPIGTGATPEDALAELREARRDLIRILLDQGDPIPEPRPLKAAVP